MNSNLITGFCLTSVVVLPLVSQARGRQAARPNVLVIMTDQQRYDALQIAGRYPFLQTPNLDRLARESAWFTHAYTPCAVSGPARSCLLTGQLVEHTRVFTNELTVEDPVEKGFTTAPTYDRVLVDNGYYAEYHGKWHAPILWTDCYESYVWFPVNRGKPCAYQTGELRDYMTYLKDKYGHLPLDEGTFVDNSMYGVGYCPDSIDRRVVRGYDRATGELLPEELQRRIHTQPDNHGMLLVDDEDSYTAFQARCAIAALKRAGEQDKPFSITLSINYPHAPMLPTRTYHEMYSVEDMPVPESIGDPMTDSPYITQNGRRNLSEYGDRRLIRYMMKNYFGLVSEVDYWIGEVLRTLDELKMSDNTIVVFLSDHGEMLGSHGMREKNVFFEESARVPFMIRYPKVIRPCRVDDDVTTLDLYATLLDYAGTTADGNDSRSLRRLIERGRGDGCVVTEWLYNGIRQPSHMIVKEGWKLFFNYSTESKVQPSLYHLDEDPFEMKNLLGRSNPNRKDYVSKAEELKRCMLKWLSERNSQYVDSLRQIKF